MAWPAIERFCRWLRPRKELLVGVVGVAVEEMAAAFPGGSIAVKLVGELAKHGVNRLLDQKAAIPEIKPAGQPFPPEQLDEINTWLERLTVIYKGLLDQLEALAGNAQDQQTLTEFVRKSLREREDLSREFTAHRREVRLMILSLSRVEQMLVEVTRKLDEQGQGQQQIASDVSEFKAFLLDLPGFMEYLRLPPEERSAVLQAHDHFLGGRREEGAALLLDSIKQRGVGHKTILKVLDAIYPGRKSPDAAGEKCTAAEIIGPSPISPGLIPNPPLISEPSEKSAQASGSIPRAGTSSHQPPKGRPEPMQTLKEGHKNDRQFAKASLTAALRHFSQGQFREAAAATGKALQLLPDLETNPATSALFERLRGKVEKALRFRSEDLEFWLEDERLNDDWRHRAEELLTRYDGPADFADSLLIIADANDLLREIAAENGKYHLVASFTGGQKRPPHYHEAAVKALAFGPENLLAAYIDDSEYGNLRVWDMSRNDTAWTDEHRFSLGEYCINCLCFSPDGRLLAFTNPFVRLRQASTGKGVKWPDDSCFYQVVAFSQDNLLLTVADTKSVPTKKKPPLCLWNTQTGRPVFQIQETSPIRCAAFGLERVESQNLALGTYDGRIHIWELSWTWTEEIPDLHLRLTGAHQVRTLHADRREIMSAAFSPEDSLLAAADGTDQVRVWNIATGELVKSLTVSADRFSQPFTAPPGCGWCNSVAFSPTDPQHLAIGCSDGTVRVLDVPTGEQVALLNQGAGQAVRVLAFHADGTLAAGSQSGRVYLWRRGLPMGVLLQGPEGGNEIS